MVGVPCALLFDAFRRGLVAHSVGRILFVSSQCHTPLFQLELTHRNSKKFISFFPGYGLEVPILRYKPR